MAGVVRVIHPLFLPLMLKYLHLTPMADLPELLVVKSLGVALVSDVEVCSAWRHQVCDWLAAAGCLTMSAWGVDSSAWDDAMDWANIAMFMPGDVPDERLILTTWHADETLLEFFGFYKAQQAFAASPAEQHLLLHIGLVDRQADLMQAWGSTP